MATAPGKKRRPTRNPKGNNKPTGGLAAEVARALFEREEQRREDAEEREPRIATRVEHLRVQQEAARRLRTEEAGPRFRVSREAGSLAEQLAEPRSGQRWAINDLLPAEGNGLLVAQYKAGKTTLAMNLARAWADGEPFLGRFEMPSTATNVAFFNYELSRTMFLDWMEEMDVDHPERIHPFHLRDWSLPFWEPEVRDELADFFAEQQIGLWIIDPAARAWRGFVEDENANSQVEAWTAAVDELKRYAGIAESLVTHHVGRTKQAEGEERGRGATRLEDWMDAGWYLTKDGETRSLRAIGRDVDLDAIDLDYDPALRRLRASGQTRDERRASDAMEDAIYTLGSLLGQRRDSPPITTELSDEMSVEKKKRSPGIRKAEKEGFIKREKGLHGAKLCDLTDAGRKFCERRVERPIRRASTDGDSED
jgi:hypothetical protein